MTNWGPIAKRINSGVTKHSAPGQLNPEPMALPAIPPVVSPGSLANWTFVTITDRVTATALEPAKTSGGAREVAPVDFPGREQRTDLGGQTLQSITLRALWDAYATQGDVGPQVSAVADCYATGKLVRLYGPLIPPATQGMVWAVTGWDVDAPTAVFNSGLNLCQLRASITLLQWRPVTPPVLQAPQSLGPPSINTSVVKAATVAGRKFRAGA